jgi:solute carrier family 45 protein 1/2/4
VLRHLRNRRASASASTSHGCEPGNRTLRYNYNMTGFSALPTADEAASEGSAQWAGVAKILGPPWARFPAITLGLVGVQVMWSIEMAYGEQARKRYPIRTLYNTGCSAASPYLISLGLSRSLMALVFIAGPLSGLIVQPLIGLHHQSPFSIPIT